MRGLGISQLWPPVQGSCPDGFVETVGYETRVKGGLAVLTPVVRCMPTVRGGFLLPEPPPGAAPAEVPPAVTPLLDQELIAGVPNKWLALGAVAAWFFFFRKG